MKGEYKDFAVKHEDLGNQYEDLGDQFEHLRTYVGKIEEHNKDLKAKLAQFYVQQQQQQQQPLSASPARASPCALPRGGLRGGARGDARGGSRAQHAEETEAEMLDDEPASPAHRASSRRVEEEEEEYEGYQEDDFDREVCALANGSGNGARSGRAASTTTQVEDLDADDDEQMADGEEGEEQEQREEDDDSEHDALTGRKRKRASGAGSGGRAAFVNGLPQKVAGAKQTGALGKRMPFSQGEKECLVKGMIKHQGRTGQKLDGTGQIWKTILKDPDHFFHPKRTAVNLKDCHRSVLKKYYGGNHDNLLLDPNAERIKYYDEDNKCSTAEAEEDAAEEGAE
ncbi:hypothetical protein T492DRAFT_1090621 [Pavlovales sp. CCMP2436]|nr:hypothetical protein T492DRAFT_1090621 [Pavlovales sp. CCMP2436]